MELNWSSRSTKQRKPQSNLCLLTVGCCTRSVAGVWSNYVPRLEFVKRSPRSRRTSTRSVLETEWGSVSRSQLASRRSYAARTQKRKVPSTRAVVRYVYYSHTHYSFRVMFREQERKKERKMNKIEIFVRGFLELDEGQRNFYSRFSIRIAKGCSL